nr:ComF family protein [Streptococcus catagoni]
MILLVKAKDIICHNCQLAFERIKQPNCSRCHKAHTEGICLDCQNWEKKDHFVSHRALYSYNEKMRDYFSSYKFQGDYVLRQVFAEEINKLIKKDYKDYTVIPVPLSDQREEERGFNQVTAVLDCQSIPYQDIIVKKESQRQSHKGKKERERSQNPFCLKKDCQIPQKILIIDDIYTTGTTLWHIVKLFKETKCEEIKTFSIAR